MKCKKDDLHILRNLINTAKIIAHRGGGFGRVWFNKKNKRRKRDVEDKHCLWLFHDCKVSSRGCITPEQKNHKIKLSSDSVVHSVHMALHKCYFSYLCMHVAKPSYADTQRKQQCKCVTTCTERRRKQQ